MKHIKLVMMISFFIFLLSITASADTTTVYSIASSDGNIYSNSAVWATARGASSGSDVETNESFSSEGGALDHGAMANNFGTYYFFRSWFVFDTSALPDNATISAVSLFLYPYNSSSGSESSICALQGTQGDTLEADDFDAFTGSEYGHVTWDNDAGAYIEISFNSTGIGNTSKTGNTYICIKEYTHDYLNATNNGNDAINEFYYADMTGTDKDPKLVITYTVPSYTISGTLKEKTSSASGAAYNYFILDATNHELFKFGTAESDGAYSVNVTNTTDEYCGIIIDNIGGAAYGGNFGTTTTNASGEWSITNAGWAEGETIWAFFIDPDKVYKTTAFSFTANASNTVADTHNEAGSPASGTLVHAADFGTSTGYEPPNPIYDFVTGQ